METNPIPNPQVPPSEPQSPTPSTAVPTAPVLSGFLTGKVVVVIVGLMLAGGATGAYFIIKNNPKDTTQKTSSLVSEKKTGGFTCNDLISNADFERIIGVKSGEYKLSGSAVVDPNKDENLAPIKQQFGEFESGAKMDSCYYEFPYQSVGWSESSLDWRVGVSILLVYGFKDDLTDRFNLLKQKTLSGIGAGATETVYPISYSLEVLSSNRKYLVTFNMEPIATNDMPAAAKQIAKIVDANLNKY